ncbi:hypothetical protein F4778DRAFT_753106 [Xylariomycetidae sp. FL2044]|nr:hypothetical protein F4778DRAFT_753106 [Xylariomycetidae sp. FL2044]
MASFPILSFYFVLTLVGARLVYNWSRLRKAPGPFLAGCSNVWLQYHQNEGTLRQKLGVLHVQHGPIVRCGVRNVSINDPEVIDVVYGSRAGFAPLASARFRENSLLTLCSTQSDAYSVLIGIQNGKEVASLIEYH